MLTNNNMQRMVNYFNDTIHLDTKVTPREIETNPELEDMWIMHCREYNDVIYRSQSKAGLLYYQLANILLVCFEKEKSSDRFQKRLRYSFISQ
jgi:hypothetical protein